MKTPTQKLSKAYGDTSVRDLRRAALSAEDVIGRAAALAGLIDGPRPMSAGDVVRMQFPEVPL